MPSNVEIKCKATNRITQRQKALELATADSEIILQHDVFFNVAEGKLKLRRFNLDRGELIYYQRNATTTPAVSQYQRSPTSDPDGLIQILSNSLGVLGEVIKERELIMCGRTRIHFDSVAGLGDFIELEVVLANQETVAAATDEARAIMAALDIQPEQHIQGTYLELLMTKPLNQNH